jgi:sugar O-acyltransferase (sialic acid O-acetyltransferase NeuD family)
MKKEILLIGGGGHCKSVIDVIEQEGIFEIVGIVDKKELVGQKVLGYKVLGCDDDLRELFEKYKYALVTVGQIKSSEIRVKLFSNLDEIGYKLPVIKSPLSYVSKYADIKEGTIIMHHAIVNADAKIGKNCIINSKALIEHDVTIEDNCHVSTGAIINGGVVVKNGTFYGSGATCKEYIEVSGFI